MVVDRYAECSQVIQVDPYVAHIKDGRRIEYIDQVGGVGVFHRLPFCLGAEPEDVQALLAGDGHHGVEVGVDRLKLSVLDHEFAKFQLIEDYGKLSESQF